MSRILSAAEQVAYLRDEKDVAFELMTEAEAEAFLAQRSYFFKLKAFAKNFDKRLKGDCGKGRYIGLDFAHLVELSRLDKRLRDLVLHLTLDIEHYLKVRINRGAMGAGCDPRALAEDFLSYSSANVAASQLADLDPQRASAALERMGSLLEGLGDAPDPAQTVALGNELASLAAEVTGGRNPDHVRASYAAMGSSPYSKGVVEKYGDLDMPYWCLMELMSFGAAIAFYKACFRKGGLIGDPGESAVCRRINNLLRRVQVLRNAAAHGDCLLNGLSTHVKSASARGVRRMLEEVAGVGGACVGQVATVPVAMDLAAVLVCYDIVVPEGETRRAAAAELQAFSARAVLHGEWFAKNYSVRSFLEYARLVCDRFAERYAGAPAEA